MSKFRPKLARYNTICCDQVMPVPVIPVCAVSCCLPRPICEYKPIPCPPCPPPPPPPPCNPPPEAVECAVTEAPIFRMPHQIPNYNPALPNPPTGTILTNTLGFVPPGYLVADGSEVSRSTYSGLFSVIGEIYGKGDGNTTFNLPNLSCEGECTPLIFIIKT